MCYCDKSEIEIRDDLERGSVPDEALVRSCCWSKICTVQGSVLNDETWEEVC